MAMPLVENKIEGRQVGILSRVARESHTEKVTYKQSPERSDGLSQVDTGTIANAMGERLAHSYSRNSKKTNVAGAEAVRGER